MRKVSSGALRTLALNSGVQPLAHSSVKSEVTSLVNIVAYPVSAMSIKGIAELRKTLEPLIEKLTLYHIFVDYSAHWMYNGAFGKQFSTFCPPPPPRWRTG
ncbi:hypothetical protein ACTXT7_007464 [Hymenolepis weldensis]